MGNQVNFEARQTLTALKSRLLAAAKPLAKELAAEAENKLQRQSGEVTGEAVESEHGVQIQLHGHGEHFPAQELAYEGQQAVLMDTFQANIRRLEETWRQAME